MRHEHRGFLYGHYDSRGGTTMIEAATREEADRRYLRDVFCFDESDIADFAAGVAEADYLGEATLSTPDVLDTPRELDDNDPALVFWLTGDKLYEPGDEDAEEFLPESPTVYRLWHSPDGTPPPEPAIHPRWNDDAFSFHFQPKK